MDGRGERFESEVRMTEFQNPKSIMRERGRLYVCGRCGHAYEEKSRHCPRCDRKSMGFLAPIPEKHIEEARRKAVERLKDKYR